MSTREAVREAHPARGDRVREFVGALVSYPATVWRHRAIIANFYSRELRARFRGTVLGFAWPFALPLALFLVYYFVFAQLLEARLGGSGPQMTEEVRKGWFTVYLFAGVIVWAGFAESVTRNATVILENANLIKKIAFPSELLPLNTILVAVTIQGIAITAYLVVAPFLGWNPISWRLLALPVLVLAQVLFSLGPSLIVSASNVFVRDTAPLLGIVMTLWQFVTPVFWARQGVAAIEHYSWVLSWNPMYYLLEGYRKVLVNPGLPQYREEDAKHAFPTAEWPFHECLLVLGAAAVVFALGYSLFLTCKKRFADEL